MSELYAGKVGRPEKPMTIVPGGMGTPIPTPPNTLGDTEVWNRLWTVGRAWLSNEAHYDLMRLLCEAMEDRDALRRAMRRKAKVTKGSVGQDRPHPGLRQIDAMDAKISRLLDQAGFSPNRRQTVAQPAGKSRLEQMKEARRAPG